MGKKQVKQKGEITMETINDIVKENNMNKKYELTDETKGIGGKILLLTI